MSTRKKRTHSNPIRSQYEPNFKMDKNKPQLLSRQLLTTKKQLCTQKKQTQTNPNEAKPNPSHVVGTVAYAIHPARPEFNEWHVDVSHTARTLVFSLALWVFYGIIIGNREALIWPLFGCDYLCVKLTLPYERYYHAETGGRQIAFFVLRTRNESGIAGSARGTNESCAIGGWCSFAGGWYPVVWCLPLLVLQYYLCQKKLVYTSKIKYQTLKCKMTNKNPKRDL